MPKTKNHGRIREGQTCPTCVHSHFPFGVARDRIGNCLFDPPTAFIVGMSTPSVIQKPQPDQMQPIIRSYFPIVTYSDSCSKWSPASEGDYAAVERLPTALDNPSPDVN